MLCITAPVEGDPRQVFVAIPQPVKELEAESSHSFCLVLTLVRGAQNTQEKLKFKCQFTCQCCYVVMPNSIMLICTKCLITLKRKKVKS